MIPVISMQNVELAIHPKLTLSVDHFELYPGQFHVLLGANGAGKSTLFSLISGQRKPDCGKVTLTQQPIASLTNKQQAQRRAVLTQEQNSVFQFTAEEIIAMGRYPWVGTAEQLKDKEIIAHAISEFELESIAERSAEVLSGGEKARVAMARISAQTTPVILLDEPTAALDLKHQLVLLKSVKNFTQAGGAALVIVHDINRALEFADTVTFLAGGRIIATGNPEVVVNAENIDEAYGVCVDVRTHPVTGRLNVTPLI